MGGSVTHVSRSGLKKFNLSHHDCSQVQKQRLRMAKTRQPAAQQFPAESSRLGTVEVTKLQELRTKTPSNSPRLFSRLWCSVVLCFGRGRFYEHLCEPSQRWPINQSQKIMNGQWRFLLKTGLNEPRHMNYVYIHDGSFIEFLTNMNMMMVNRRIRKC